MVTTPIWAKYVPLVITIILSLLDYFAQPQNQMLTTPVIIGAVIVVLTLILHDMEPTTPGAKQ